VQLTEQVLGVTPVDPGYAMWSVKPHPGSLRWAQGVVPTKYGAISASWTAGRQFTLRVTTPLGTRGVIAVPAAVGTRITVNGKVVRAAVADGYAAISVPGGSYTVTSSGC
jgi:hypothetical protein